MIISFKLLIENSDSVPELWVFDVFKTVESSLVRVERLLKIFNHKVAMTKSSPGWTIL